MLIHSANLWVFELGSNRENREPMTCSFSSPSDAG
jgi:hypothetical protein